MRKIGRYSTAAAAIAAALGAGHLMQWWGAGDSPGQARVAMAAVAPAAAPALETVTDIVPLAAGRGVPLPEDPALPPRPARLAGGAAAPVALRPVPADAAATPSLPAFGALGLPCEAALFAAPSPGGMIRVTLEAPCLAGAILTLRHGPLVADLVASSSGALEAMVPALSAAAEVTLTAPDGQVLSARAEVPDAAAHARFATLWTGETPLEIHAFEDGADYGEPGHVWAGAPREAAVAEAGRGGFLVRLGTPGLEGGRWAEVYTLPLDPGRVARVRLQVEVPVTAASCGRDLTARVLQIGPDSPGAPVDLRLAMPDCDAAGGYLVLKGIAQDLRIASN
jgi:hypothetical protein